MRRKAPGGIEAYRITLSFGGVTGISAKKERATQKAPFGVMGQAGAADTDREISLALRVLVCCGSSLLTVRSFLGWFVKISTQPCIDVDGKVQQRQNALLQGGEGREMKPPALSFPNNGQGQPLKAFQQTLSGGVGGGALRVPGIPPCQHALLCRQAPTGHELQQGQHAQPDRRSRINPVAWSSRSRYIGVRDKGRPFNRPMSRSMRYSLR